MGGHSSFHVQTALFSFVNQLELRSAYFERYCRNWLSFTELNEHFLIYLFRSPRYRQWNLQSCHHCVQHPWKLASRDFWSSRNKRKPMDPPGYTKFGRQTFFWWWTIATDVYWSRMAISHWYTHLVVKNGNFTLLLTSSSQEWQFHISTDILVVKNGNFTLLLTSSF